MSVQYSNALVDERRYVTTTLDRTVLVASSEALRGLRVAISMLRRLLSSDGLLPIFFSRVDANEAGSVRRTAGCLTCAVRITQALNALRRNACQERLRITNVQYEVRLLCEEDGRVIDTADLGRLTIDVRYA